MAFSLREFFPQIGVVARLLNDVDICTVQGAGSLSFCSTCSESRLAGDLGNVVLDEIMSTGVETLAA